MGLEPGKDQLVGAVGRICFYIWTEALKISMSSSQQLLNTAWSAEPRICCPLEKHFDKHLEICRVFFFLYLYILDSTYPLFYDLGENFPFSPEILLLIIDIILLRKGHSSGISKIHFCSDFSPSLISPFTRSQTNKATWCVPCHTDSDFESPGRKTSLCSCLSTLLINLPMLLILL